VGVSPPCTPISPTNLFKLSRYKKNDVSGCLPFYFSTGNPNCWYLFENIGEECQDDGIRLAFNFGCGPVCNQLTQFSPLRRSTGIPAIKEAKITLKTISPGWTEALGGFYASVRLLLAFGNAFPKLVSDGQTIWSGCVNQACQQTFSRSAGAIQQALDQTGTGLAQ
jgi:hypothetical protein